MGKRITEQLIKTGIHTVTALTRHDSKSEMLVGAKVVRIDYDDESSIVAALRGQQFLVITMSVMAPPEQHSKLVQAAAKAHVPYVMPNGYGIDIANENLNKDLLTPDLLQGHLTEIENTGASWIVLVCSLWYEYSLAMGPEWYGFDFKNKKVTFFDDGNTRINTSTWEQCGRAVAALLSLKELPEDENDKAPTVSTWRNKPMYISSFLINQKEMFESWKRVTGDRDEDWTIEYQPTAERYAQGIERFKAGDRRGWAEARFTRIFFPNGDGNYEDKYGLANAGLGLPKEDLDECTKVAKKMIDEDFAAALRRVFEPAK